MSILIEKESVDGIERSPDRCGGYPVIVGTRTAVRHVVEHLRVSGGGFAGLLEAFPHLTQAQLEAALVYYATSPEVIEEDIERNRRVKSGRSALRS